MRFKNYFTLILSTFRVHIDMVLQELFWRRVFRCSGLNQMIMRCLDRFSFAFYDDFLLFDLLLNVILNVIVIVLFHIHFGLMFSNQRISPVICVVPLFLSLVCNGFVDSF